MDPSEALGGDGNPLTDVFQWLSQKFLERSKQLELEKNFGIKKTNGSQNQVEPPTPPEIFSFKTWIFFVGRNSPNPWDFGEVHLFGSPQ